ncbi:MAG TPA: cytochrome c [Acidobacteriaceae bacterium]|jgi:mono/diheme cytochrome c family protein|nr:cytochrome c [Acidobacteriaceae bacterium]
MAGVRPGRSLEEQNVKQQLWITGMILLGASFAMSAVAQQPGEATYKAKCAMCHGADGTASTPVGKSMKLRSLRSPEDVKATDDMLFKQTREGVGKMQGYAGKMTDAQIRDVVAYIRTLQK